jgi:YesN/AraC family two-component response regulator
MPGLTGIELIQKLRLLNIRLKIIMITGFEIQDLQMNSLPPLDGFLCKPFKAADLLDCLDRLDY